MRKIFSVLLSVLAISVVVALSPASPVQAAPGDITTIRGTDFAPTSVPNARIESIRYLASENGFLVLGRDSQTQGSQLHLWKLKSDLTVDTSFPVVDLGSNFSAPTSSNSTCSEGCADARINVHESAGLFSVTWYRWGMKGTDNSTAEILSVATGSLKTGVISGTAATISPSNKSTTDLAPWSAFGNTNIGRETCVASSGSTYQSIPLSYYWLRQYNILLHPNGSLIVTVDCTYSNADGNTSSVSEYTTSQSVAVKISGSAFSVDTSWGANGYEKIIDDPTKCNTETTFSTMVDGSITSSSSTKTFFIRFIESSARVTTVPTGPAYQNVTAYNGCNTMNSSQTITSAQLRSVTINGSIKKVTTIATDDSIFINRFVIDPQGRWVGLVDPGPMMSDPNATPIYSTIRILPDGNVDTTNGTNGIKPIPDLPSTISVNGNSLRMNYFITGAARLESNETLFMGFSQTYGSYCNGQQNSVGTATFARYPYYFSPESGLVKSFGQDGLGQAFSYDIDLQDACTNGFPRQTQFVNKKGQPSLIVQVKSVGSQSSGLILATWEPANGVVGGGDGSDGSSSGSSGRTDTKVYSSALPKVTQTNTTLKILTRKTTRIQRLISRTPRTCTTLNGTVLLLRSGICSVGIVNKSTNKIIRTLSTTIKTEDATSGTTIIAQDPVMFKQGSSRLTKKTQTQVKLMVESAKDAKRIYVIGHSAQLFAEDSIFNYALSRNRARHVAGLLRSELRKAKVKVPVVVIAVGSRAQLSMTKTEKAQSQNRRVEVYFG